MKASGWWKKVLAVVEGSDGGCLEENLVPKLGDGREVAFWTGSWAGEKALKDVFPRLFHLSINKDGVVKEMGNWIDGRWEWDVKWRKDLLERERGRELELLEYLANFSPSADATDRWCWGREGDSVFTVKIAYQFMDSRSSSQASSRPMGIIFVRVWKAFAPLKARTAWRLLWNRVPTKENMSKRIELNLDERC